MSFQLDQDDECDDDDDNQEEIDFNSKSLKSTLQTLKDLRCSSTTEGRKNASNIRVHRKNSSSQNEYHRFFDTQLECKKNIYS